MTDDEIYNPEKIRKQLKINELNLEDELCTVASFYFNYSALETDAEEAYNLAVLQLETYEVDLAKYFKQELLNEGVKPEKITETEVKRRFRKDEKWAALKNKEITAHTNFKKLGKAAKSFEMKNHACININKRQLFKAGKGMEDL